MQTADVRERNRSPEGLDDMFTVRRLGLSDRLSRTLTNTNAIESMIAVVGGHRDLPNGGQLVAGGGHRS